MKNLNFFLLFIFIFLGTFNTTHAQVQMQKGEYVLEGVNFTKSDAAQLIGLLSNVDNRKFGLVNKSKSNVQTYGNINLSDLNLRNSSSNDDNAAKAGGSIMDIRVTVLFWSTNIWKWETIAPEDPTIKNKVEAILSRYK